jgi:hypothetical protein
MVSINQSLVKIHGYMLTTSCATFKRSGSEFKVIL